MATNHNGGMLRLIALRHDDDDDDDEAATTCTAPSSLIAGQCATSIVNLYWSGFPVSGGI